MIDVDYNEYKKTIAENMKLIVENHKLEEVEKEHQKLNGELREEIERLNNKNEELLTLYTTEREVKDYYKNIINEFEDILKRDIKACNNKFENMFDRNYRRLILEEKLEQLQELKGSDK